MFKKLTLTTTALLTLTLAQAQLYIGANAGINNTKLYNTSDAKADERQDYVLTLKPQFGLDLGYKINKKLSIGIQPQMFKAAQKYKGYNPSFFQLENAYSNIDYLKIPFYLQYNLASSNKKSNVFFRVGAYYGTVLRSKSYTKYSNATPLVSNDYLGSMESIVDGTDVVAYNTYYPINQLSYQDTFRAKYSVSGVNGVDFGLNLSCGYTFTLGNKLALQLAISSNLGLKNIENSGQIFLKDFNTGVVIDSFSNAQEKYCKYNLYPKPTDAPRSTLTTNRAIGLQLGFIFLLGNKEEFEPKRL